MAGKPIKKVSKSKDEFDAPNVIVKTVEVVDCDSLTMFHKNPRIGNVSKIAESLKTNGMFKPIVVNIGTKTGRENEILAGNHSWLATKRNGDLGILAAFVDVDDETATRINLADNRTSDDGEYDDRILAELLASLPDAAVGTGFDQDEIDRLLEDIDIDVDETVDEVTGQLDAEARAEEQLRQKETFEGSDLGEEPDPRTAPRDDRPDIERPGQEDSPSIEKASDTLKGGYNLKDDLDLNPGDFVGEWGIPRLRTDMLATWDDLPEKLKAWAGSASRDEPDPDMHWLYNWGIDSTSGMKDISKVIVSFFAFDEYFENWWHYPDRFVTKCLNSGIKTILTPDFSMASPETESRATSMWALYRQRWLGRYFQEAGLKVIPNITWAWHDQPFLFDHILPTLPPSVPLLAFQIQAVFEKGMDAKEKDKEMRDIAKVYQQILDTLQPDDVLLYYGSQGREMWEKYIKFDGRVKWVESRLVALGEQQKNRSKKTTI